MVAPHCAGAQFKAGNVADALRAIIKVGQFTLRQGQAFRAKRVSRRGALENGQRALEDLAAEVCRLDHGLRVAGCVGLCNLRLPWRTPSTARLSSSSSAGTPGPSTSSATRPGSI